MVLAWFGPCEKKWCAATTAARTATVTTETVKPNWGLPGFGGRLFFVPRTTTHTHTYTQSTHTSTYAHTTSSHGFGQRENIVTKTLGWYHLARGWSTKRGKNDKWKTEQWKNDKWKIET